MMRMPFWGLALVLIASGIGTGLGGALVVDWCYDTLYPGIDNYTMVGPTLCTYITIIILVWFVSGMLMFSWWAKT